MKQKPRLLKWMQSNIDKGLTKLESAHLKLLGAPLWALEAVAVAPTQKMTNFSEQKLIAIYSTMRKSNHKAGQWAGDLFSGKVAKAAFGPSRKTVVTKSAPGKSHNGANHTAHS